MVAITTLLAGLATVLAPALAAFSDPLACSGVCTDTHDPSLIRRSSDGKYFRFATGLSIHTAPALTGPWTNAGNVLSGGSKINNPGSKGPWAPDVSLVGNTYYLYYAVSSFGTQNSAIGLATSTTMEAGSWTDHGSTGLQSKTGDPYNAIDPNLIQVNGANFLTFGSFWGDIYQTQLSSDALTWTKAAPYNVELNKTASRSSEGSYVFAHGGYYYLFWSSGQCCGYDSSKPAPGEEYKVMVCRSKSYKGPFVDQKGAACTSNGGTLVLGSHGKIYGPGGQGIYNDPSKGPVIYYHYVDTTIGYADGDKRLGVNVLKWSSDGWPSV